MVPRQDEFQGEYVAAYAERLRWLTGFAGSWGLAILMLDRGAIFVDGRYTIQVGSRSTRQSSRRTTWWNPPTKWIEKNLKAGEALGFDPWLITAEQADKLRQCLHDGRRQASACRHQSDRQPVGATSRHGQPRRSPVQPTQFAGRSAEDKSRMSPDR